MSLEKKESIVNGKIKREYFLNEEKISKKEYDKISQDYLPDDINLTFENYLIDPLMREFYHTMLEFNTELEAIDYLIDFFIDFSKEISAMAFAESFRQQAELLESMAEQIEDGDYELLDLGEDDLDDEEY